MSHSHDTRACLSHEPHAHGHGAVHHHGGLTDGRRLAIALAVILIFAAVEVVGGLISGSLALLADAGHMVTDGAAIALALWARQLAAKPVTPEFTFGRKRAQVLAAFVNGLALFLLIGYLFIESFQRISEPIEIGASTMLMVAILGLGANLVAFYILHRGDREDVNMRGAVLHVIGDILGSVAAIISAIVIGLTNWVLVDPLVTLLVCLLIGRSAWSLVNETARVLLEGAPPHISPGAVRAELMKAVPEAVNVHDIRIWMLTPDTPQITMHVHVADPSHANQTLADMKAVLLAQFGIRQSTIQIECGPVVAEASVQSGFDAEAETAEANVAPCCPDRHPRGEARQMTGLSPAVQA